MPNATFTFRPFLKLGIGTKLSVSEGESHAKASVELHFNSGLKASKEIGLIGPGEIASIAHSEIIRTYPRPYTPNAESNYFPFIEFEQADLPWRYTPTPKMGERLKPWIVLIALTEEEFTLKPADKKRKIRSHIIVDDVQALPDLDQSWAWTHVQITGSADQSMSDLLNQFPDQVISRLMCPRHLAPDTTYHVFLVPSFERGLREFRSQTNEAAARSPAWNAETQNGVSLPFYYAWEFTTGEGGDFETLVKKLLPPVSLPGIIGFKEMDVRDLGYGLPSANKKNPSTVYMKGALTAPAAKMALRELEESTKPNPAFEKDFRALLNQAAITVDLEDDETLLPVAPPLYGQWHAAQKRIEEGAAQTWFEQVNTDLSMRAAAGLGVRVVKENQESLMAGAWDQLPDIEAFNQRMRQYQLSLETSKCIYKKHFLPLSEEKAFRLTAKVHEKVQLANRSQNIRNAFENSSVPVAIFSPALRKMTRPSGAVFKKMKFKQLENKDKKLLLARLYTQNISLFQPLESVESTTEDEARPNLANAITEAVDIQISPPPALNDLKTRLIDQINPDQTIRQPISNQIELPAWMKWRADRETLTPLEPVMEAPAFEQAMYMDLRKLSSDWLLPGVEHLPHNAISLLETNQKFIEAFMLGLNHEMARELLWREYPTDQRGTYFKQFWDAVYYEGLQGETVESETDLQDVNDIHEWGNRPLGENRPLPFSGQDNVALLIKGDLLARYPNAIIYAQKATLEEAENNTFKRSLGTKKRYPIFQGFIPPDVRFLGFPLTKEEVVGIENDRAEDQGWFFVLKEHSSEPRFGLDLTDKENNESFGLPVVDWDNITWNHLAENEAALRRLKYIDLAAELPQIAIADENNTIRWKIERSSNSAHIAYITFQRPFMAAIHASDMLPPGEGSER